MTASTPPIYPGTPFKSGRRLDDCLPARLPDGRLPALTHLCQGLFGLTISQGAIADMLARVGEVIAAPAERYAAEVHASEVIASDETVRA